MAVTENKNYIIVPIDTEWSNFRIEQCGKDITILGYDGKTTDQWAGVFSGIKPTEPVFEEVILTGIEQHWKDLATWIILDEGTDEYGKRYLILVREKHKLHNKNLFAENTCKGCGCDISEISTYCIECILKGKRTL